MNSGLALLRANVRYWSTVAPAARAQLERWRRRARAIEDPVLRDLALGKLREERFNVELAATLARGAAPAHRRDAVVAIVALQVAYDYLDVLDEQPPDGPPLDARGLRGALADALDPLRVPTGERPYEQDGGYLRELVQTVGQTLARLPAAEAVGEVALRGARRCAEAQAIGHAAARGETATLVAWATREAARTDGLHWQEFLAGATASVLAVHALIGAAGNPRTTRRDAEAIDAAYLPICALTMLDSLLDREQDLATGQLNYLDLYDSPEQLAERLAALARAARNGARALPDAADHLVTLTGVVAYYASAAAARNPPARPAMVAARGELGWSIVPALTLMRAWRLAKRWRKAAVAGVSSRTG